MFWNSIKEGVMYRVIKMSKTICGKTEEIYGIADDETVCYDFTKDKSKAEEVAELLNANDVSPCHVFEIIEDMIYG